MRTKNLFVILHVFALWRLCHLYTIMSKNWQTLPRSCCKITGQILIIYGSSITE